MKVFFPRINVIYWFFPQLCWSSEQEVKHGRSLLPRSALPPTSVRVYSGSPPVITAPSRGGWGSQQRRLRGWRALGCPQGSIFYPWSKHQIRCLDCKLDPFSIHSALITGVEERVVWKVITGLMIRNNGHYPTITIPHYFTATSTQNKYVQKIIQCKSSKNKTKDTSPSGFFRPAQWTSS